MKLLLTGATGFIGQHLTARLINSGHEVCVIVRPSTDSGKLQKLGVKYFIFDNDLEKLKLYFLESKFDGIIHLATIFLTNHQSADIPSLIQSNVFLPTALLEAAIYAQVPWFINTSTQWQHYQNKKYSPVNLYAATKQAFETLAQYYWETSDLNFINLVLTDTFGTNDSRSKILSLWYKIAKSGETIDMSPGEQVVDFIYVENVVDAFEQMIKLLSQNPKTKYRGNTLAVRSGEALNLKKLVKVFTKVTGLKPAINWGAKPYSPRQMMAPWENSPLVPGWKPKISLAKGIKLDRFIN